MKSQIKANLKVVFLFAFFVAFTNAKRRQPSDFNMEEYARVDTDVYNYDMILDEDIWDFDLA